MSQSLQKQLKALLGEAVEPSDLIKIISLIPSESEHDDFILYRARVKQLENTYRNGLITGNLYNVELNVLRESLLFLIEKYLSNSDQLRMPGKTTIQYVSATPTDADGLQVDREFKSIRDAIQLSVYRERYDLLLPAMGASIDDLMRMLLARPTIVHIASHAGRGGVLLANNANEGQVASGDALADLFSVTNSTQLVFLNSCNSAYSAPKIGRHVKYVIAMNDPIVDATSIVLAEAFYTALCNSSDYDISKCFHLARAVMKVKKPDEEKTPELWVDGDLQTGSYV